MSSEVFDTYPLPFPFQPEWVLEALGMGQSISSAAGASPRSSTTAGACPRSTSCTASSSA